MNRAFHGVIIKRMDRGNTRYATNIINRSAGVFSIITETYEIRFIVF